MLQTNFHAEDDNKKEGNHALAIRLATAGFPVFPCRAADEAFGKAKAPLTSNGFKSATTDLEQIGKWWLAHPGAVVGLPTGAVSGLSVLDGDIDRETGEATGEGQLAELGLTEPSPVKVRTPSGGVHLIFAHVEGAKSTAKQLASHVDTRGNGGYIIAPGSVMASGASYTCEGESLEEAFMLHSLPAYPLAKVNAAIAERKTPKPAPEAPTGPTVATGEETIEVTRLLLAEAPNTLAREDWVKLALSLRVTFGDTFLSDFLSFSVRYSGGTPCDTEAAQRLWDSANNPSEVSSIAPALRLLQNALGDARTKEIWRDVMAKRDSVSPADFEFDPHRPALGNPLSLQDSASFCAARTPADYLVEGSLRDSWLYTFTAPTGHGKTAVAMAMMKAIAGGGYLGSHEVKQGSVLFLAGENHDDVRERWIAMCEKEGIDPASLPVTFMPGVYDLKGSLPALHAHFANTPLRLVIVDTLAAFFSGDNENDNAQMQAFTNEVLRPLTALPGRPCVIVPAHPTKGAGKDSLMPKGGSSLLNAVDGNLSAWNSDGSVRVHWQGKFRGAAWMPMHFELSEYNSDQLRDSQGRQMPTVIARAMLDSEIGKAVEAAEKIENQVLKLLNDGLSFRAIAEDVIAEGKRGVSKARVQRCVDRLREMRWITKSGRKWALTNQGIAVLKQASEDRENDD